MGPIVESNLRFDWLLTPVSNFANSSSLGCLQVHSFTVVKHTGHVILCCCFSFLRYVQDNGGYSGCDFDELEDQMEDIEQRFQAVNISADRGMEINTLNPYFAAGS